MKLVALTAIVAALAISTTATAATPTLVGVDVDAPEQRVELPDPVEALEADHDAAGDRDRAAGEPGPAAACRQRHVVLVAPAHQGGDLLGARGEHHRVGRALHAAPHQVGEKPPLRFHDRVRRYH